MLACDLLKRSIAVWTLGTQDQNESSTGALAVAACAFGRTAGATSRAAAAAAEIHESERFIDAFSFVELRCPGQSRCWTVVPASLRTVRWSGCHRPSMSGIP